MEITRAVILLIGWPLLIGGSAYLVFKTVGLYRSAKKAPWSKLVLGMVIGWLTSMYSLAITASFYLFDNLARGLKVVIPIFLVWCLTMGVIIWSVVRWSKEASTLTVFYKKLEELVKYKTKELERAYTRGLENEKKIRELNDRFIFVAAHELKTPVTGLRWGLSVLMHDEKFMKTVNDEHRSIIDNLHLKIQSLVALVDDLLNVARYNTKGEAVQIEHVAIKELVQSVAEDVRSVADKAKVLLLWPINNQTLPLIKGNSQAFKEILSNLIINGIRYNKPGGTVEISAETMREDVIIHIKDTGIGIPRQEFKNLFQAFYRVPNKLSATVPGTGLGLFISKKLLEHIGGRIWVTSQKNKGSTFSFSLPAVV